VIQERLKKHGIDTPFGVFIKSEVSRMADCLQAIIDDLKVSYQLTRAKEGVDSTNMCMCVCGMSRKF
jgi:hypothetical protein